MKRLIVFLFMILGASCGFAQTITNVVVSATTSSTATIQWTTNTSANSIILYGTSATLNSSTSIDPASVTSHTEVISNLQSGTLYYFAVKSGSTTSSTYNFSLCGNPIVSAFGSTNNYYQYGAYTFTWVPPTGSSVTPTVCGVPITQTVTGSLSGSGSFNSSVADSSMVLPGPGQWQVRVQDAANVAPVTITTGITYNGIDLTSSLASGITSAGLSSVLKNGAGLVQVSSLQAGTGTPLTGAVINATQSNVGGTTQINVQNTSSDNAASSDLVATSDNGNNTTYFVDLGCNSSTYNQAAYNSGGADDCYLYASDGNLNIGSAHAGKVVNVNVGGLTTTQTVAQFNPTGLSLPGNISSATQSSATNCSSSASPAVCAASSAGSVVVAAAGTTVTVNTTAVTANSQIFVQEDSSLGTKLSVTCNVTPATAPPTVSARVAATSFTITTTAPTTNPRCFSYDVIN